MSNIIRIKHVMQKEVDMVQGMATIQQALENMKYPHNQAMIVEKRHDDDEYGMLLVSDIARQVLARDRAPERVNVYEVMVKPVVSVDPEMDIRYCARLLDRFQLTRVPVIEQSKVCGMISFTDLVFSGMRIPRRG